MPIQEASLTILIFHFLIDLPVCRQGSIATILCELDIAIVAVVAVILMPVPLNSYLKLGLKTRTKDSLKGNKIKMLWGVRDSSFFSFSKLVLITFKSSNNPFKTLSETVSFYFYLLCLFKSKFSMLSIKNFSN